MGFMDAIGPAIAIAVIYMVYKVFMDLETDQKAKETAVEVTKIQAETEREKVRLEREKLFTQYNQQQLPVKEADAEYKFLEDKKDEEVN